MIERKSWDEFRETGLLLFVNEFLSIFGWNIVAEVDAYGTKNVYPVKTNLGGFSEESQTFAYRMLKYLNIWKRSMETSKTEKENHKI